ncbi:hypothetical protein EAH79_13440 [Sphingomonas koreensis]|nr:hypothetical protein EAH87_00420 [Sphingomonas koreensis]TPG39702.1 hypothetical protein EAH79_13440 [Sphingomonas koreensis]
MRTMIIAAAALLLGACATDNAPPPQTGPQPIETDSITLETQPCFGACPVYAVTVTPDGHGVFTGKRFTAVTGDHDFTLSRVDYRHFAEALAPYHPAGGEVRYEMGSANCGPAPTDMPSIDVTWSSQIGSSERLHFYFGCSRKNPDLAAALRAAPGLLPIADMIGKH